MSDEACLRQRHSFGRTPFARALIIVASVAVTAQAQSINADENAAGEILLDVAPSSDDLTEQTFVRQVLASNPSIDQMAAVWRAAQARIRQVWALDDPMVGGQVGPQSFDSKDPGYRVEASQKFYFPGKRSLRARAAAFDAAAAARDVELVRQQLAEEASLAYFDYFLVFRSLEINADSLQVVKRLRANAESRFTTGRALQQDVLQADVEIGLLEEQRITLNRIESVAQARINTLLSRDPNAPLPNLPKDLITPAPPAHVDSLIERAEQQRPELAGLAQQIEAERTRWALTHKEYYPDFELMAAYDAFWRQNNLRPMVGVRMNAPVRRAKRDAAVAEAQSRVSEKMMEYRSKINDVRYEVAQAYQEVIESDAIVRLYGEKLIKAAEQSVSEAQSSYVTSRSDFLTLMTAQRSVFDLKLRYYEALAEAFKRRATLRRAVGDPVLVSDFAFEEEKAQAAD